MPGWMLMVEKAELIFMEVTFFVKFYSNIHIHFI